MATKKTQTVHYAVLVELRGSDDGKEATQAIVLTNNTVFRRQLRGDAKDPWKGNVIPNPDSWMREYVKSQRISANKREIYLPPAVVQVTEAEAAEAKGGKVSRGLRSRLDAVYTAVALPDGAIPNIADNDARIAGLLGFLAENDSDELDASVHPNGRCIATGKAAEVIEREYADAIAAASKDLPEIIDGKVTRPNGQVYNCRQIGDLSDVAALRIARMDDLGVFMYGPPGTGKTVLAEAAFGKKLFVVMGTSDTDVYDFVGNWNPNPDGTFTWIDGPLIKAAESGGVLLIDEVGLVDPKVLSVAYSLMDGRRELYVTPNPARGTIKAAPGFFVVGATNPNAPGVRLSEALLSRFSIHIEVTTDYDLAVELGVPSQLVAAARNLETKRLNGECEWSPQLRELLATSKVSERFGPETALRNLVGLAPENERQVVADVLASVYGREIEALAHDRSN